ncbi:phosphotransferase [Pseudalkalibacillus hwajinpoensis]|uniref:phosphotransferase enzyme family protein n=1 Tax=Guptibacillus hwajinpoensis TaxID=208199 RepID=UPI00325A60B6
MESWIEALFSEDILKEAITRFGLQAADMKLLGDFENYVYEVREKTQVYVLRLTHSSHRSFQEVEAEIDWINDLHQNGANVSYVYPSTKQQFVEELPIQQGSFYACLFEKAPGYSIKPESTFHTDLFEAWGKEVGKVHRLSMNYRPGKNRRKRWDQGDLIHFDRYLVNKDDAEIVREGKKLVETIKLFHETGKSFGLIHSDVHHGNFFFDGKEVHLFDFDDSTYHYYVSDLAIPVYYAIWRTCHNESLEVRSAFASEFMYAFLKGYQKESLLDKEWLKTLPFFLRLRDYELYTVFHKKFDVPNMKNENRLLLANIRHRLIQNEVIADINYDNVMEKLQSI